VAPLGAPVNGQMQPAGGRRIVRTGAGITLITAGAISRFAVTTTSTHALNIHIIGVILILAGVLSLLLPLLVRGPRRRRDRPVGYERAAPPAAQQRFPQDQQPAADDRRVYQDQPPA
jgi:hypothetical protein